jgi:uroporphyrinogen decarboxylase
MRQAGRYLPDYKAVRAKHDFFTVCETPELSTRVALEPIERFDLDAAIVFSDILIVPRALGTDVRFDKGHGPVLTPLLRSSADLRAWTPKGAMDRLAFMPRAVAALRSAVGEDRAVIGFAGAPFTLFSYCVEGGGSDDFRNARAMLWSEPGLARDAIGIIADVVADLCVAQLAAGADVVQLFDTWGGMLTLDQYRRFSLPAIERVAEKVHAHGGKLMLFARGGDHLLDELAKSSVDGVSIDWRTSWTKARARLPKHVLQGNIDPIALLSSDEALAHEVRNLLGEIRASGERGSIVNLGHGILPETPPERVKRLVDEVRQWPSLS